MRLDYLQKVGVMPHYKGMLSLVVQEKRDQFAARLKAVIDSKKKWQKQGTLKAIAEHCGVHDMTVQSWLKARSFPENEHVECLATFFGMTVQEFLGNDLSKYYREKG